MLHVTLLSNMFMVVWVTVTLASSIFCYTTHRYRVFHVMVQYFIIICIF